MTIRTHTGDRRELVRSISERLGQEAVYQRTPTYAYVIGPVTVDREGAVICEDDATLDTLIPFLVEQGFIMQDAFEEGTVDHENDVSKADADVPVNYTVAADDTSADEPVTGALEISVPIHGMDVNQLRNMIHTMHGYQYLLNRATRSESFVVSGQVLTALADNPPVNVADFIDLMYSFSVLGDLRGVDFKADAVALTFPADASPEKNRAYTDLTAAIVAAARKAKRVDPTVRRAENEKYTLRSFLLRLGLGGADSRATRMALLTGLAGHTAFRSDAEAQKHKDKYAEIRRIARMEREGEAS